jgi:predicted GH43/DUF377 family glycosyl hydrolase
MAFTGDDRRVILLPFDMNNRANASSVIDKVSTLPEDVVNETLDHVIQLFGERHKDFTSRLEHRCSVALSVAHRDGKLSTPRRRLIGAMLSMEYSLEAAALFNPSVVPHFDQSNLAEGELRFILSLRATGEGHISSIVFRTGVIGADQGMRLDEVSRFAARVKPTPDQRYHKQLFRRKLEDIDRMAVSANVILKRLGEWFTFEELEKAITAARAEKDVNHELEQIIREFRWLARSNYQLKVEENTPVSELVIYPRSKGEAHGMEDLRLVQFRHENGEATYYGTYTAYDGRNILPMMLETSGFRTIAIHTLNGACVQNKGMALFPRKINGHFVMCGRIDGRNLFLMRSDMVHFWETAKILAQPKYPWELRLMGNCGSPLETEEGWLLFTHGVGPMRRYCIGAMLLDLEKPHRIRGRLRLPLIEPTEEFREGYVPNVVYSCGSLIHNGTVYLPYAVADTESHIATIDLPALLNRLLHDGP